MANQTFDYVSNQRLLYFTQKLKQKFPTAADFIDDTAAAVNKMYSSSKIDELLAGKVSTENGKGLTSNDFTDEYKAMLDDLDLTDIIDDEAAATATDKTYSVKKITELFAALTGLQFAKIEPDAEGHYVLPATGDAGTIYLMPNGGSNPNIYDEYVYLKDGTWEKIGTTDIDLSNYVQYDDLVEITTKQIDDIFVTVWGDAPATT